ncbi:hypothetical protein PPO43_01080 [Saprospira sp. CCB-QB6]|uniref:hypothetical protein n=1 Tax=Saprospira sp. CCB-QB6 TaxID=3023936 RepID=UPI00234A1867|nr:hypothetical protein [Saprospira sp. CCB-QB6]WCL81688.1 hypothetical protein PPO43_01080 [Saprospira sp. CCB-QB6]
MSLPPAQLFFLFFFYFLTACQPTPNRDTNKALEQLFEAEKNGPKHQTDRRLHQFKHLWQKSELNDSLWPHTLAFMVSQYGPKQLYKWRQQDPLILALKDSFAHHQLLPYQAIQLAQKDWPCLQNLSPKQQNYIHQALFSPN